VCVCVFGALAACAVLHNKTGSHLCCCCAPNNRRRHTRPVLRPDGAVPSGRGLPADKLPVYGRLCGPRLLLRRDIPALNSAEGGSCSPYNCHAHTRTHACSNTHVHTITRARIHTRKLTRAYTHMYIHTRVCLNTTYKLYKTGAHTPAHMHL